MEVGTRVCALVYGGGYSHWAVAPEEQVLVPERRLIWEQWFHSALLPELLIAHWAIRLLGANTSDDTELAKAVPAFTQGAGTTPNALIRLFNEQTGQKEELITEPWGDRPLVITMKLLELGLDPNSQLGDALAASPAMEEGEEEGTELEQQLDEEGNPLPVGSAQPPADGAAQDTALNGAQVTAALAIVQEAVAGTITQDMAEAMLVEFFNLSPASAQAILADVDDIEPPEPDPVVLPPGAPAGPGGVSDGPPMEEGGEDGDQRERVQRSAAVRALAVKRATEKLAEAIGGFPPDWRG